MRKKHEKKVCFVPSTYTSLPFFFETLPVGKHWTALFLDDVVTEEKHSVEQGADMPVKTKDAEGKDWTRMNLGLPVELYKKLGHMAVDQGVTLSECIVGFILKGLEAEVPAKHEDEKAGWKACASFSTGYYLGYYDGSNKNTPFISAGAKVLPFNGYTGSSHALSLHSIEYTPRQIRFTFKNGYVTTFVLPKGLDLNTHNSIAAKLAEGSKYQKLVHPLGGVSEDLPESKITVEDPVSKDKDKDEDIVPKTTAAFPNELNVSGTEGVVGLVSTVKPLSGEELFGQFSEKPANPPKKKGFKVKPGPEQEDELNVVPVEAQSKPTKKPTPTKKIKLSEHVAKAQKTAKVAVTPKPSGVELDGTEVE